MSDENKKEEQLVEKALEQEPQGVLKYFQSKFSAEDSSKEE